MGVEIILLIYFELFCTFILTRINQKVVSLVVKTGGFPTEKEYIARYCQHFHRPASIPHWEFYLALNLFRMASIAQVQSLQILVFAGVGDF